MVKIANSGYILTLCYLWLQSSKNKMYTKISGQYTQIFIAFGFAHCENGDDNTFDSYSLPCSFLSFRFSVTFKFFVMNMYNFITFVF